MKLFGVLGVVACWVTTLAADDVTSSQARKYSKQLQALVRGSRPASLNDFITEMGELDHPRVVTLIPPAAILVPSAANYATACKTIAELEEKASIEALVKILAKRRVDFRQKVLLLEAFGMRCDPTSIEAIIEALEDKISHVQVAAIRACRSCKARAPIPALLDVLEKHWKLRDRTYFEAHSALIALTGRTFESMDDWRKFWETVKDSLDPAQVGKEEGPTQVATAPEDSVSFFGSEIFSRNLIFVIDVSGSMAMFDDGNENRPRLLRAKEELTQALAQLQTGALFNVIAFSNTVKSWQPKMQPATRSTVASATRFVNAFKALAATHTDEALEKTFEDLRVDTVVLLSDGAPIKQSERNSKRLGDKIIRWVRDINSSRRVRINTFGFDKVGEWPANLQRRMPPPPTEEEQRVFVEFLETLAKESGGIYRSIE